MGFAMRSVRPTPPPLQVLRDSQREMWKPRCAVCGGEDAAAHALRARVRELESQLRELEARLAITS